MRIASTSAKTVLSDALPVLPAASFAVDFKTALANASQTWSGQDASMGSAAKTHAALTAAARTTSKQTKEQPDTAVSATGNRNAPATVATASAAPNLALPTLPTAPSLASEAPAPAAQSTPAAQSSAGLSTTVETGLDAEARGYAAPVSPSVASSPAPIPDAASPTPASPSALSPAATSPATASPENASAGQGSASPANDASPATSSDSVPLAPTASAQDAPQLRAYQPVAQPAADPAQPAAQPAADPSQPAADAAQPPASPRRQLAPTSPTTSTVASKDADTQSSAAAPSTPAEIAQAGAALLAQASGTFSLPVGSPVAAASLNSGNGSQPVGKTSQKQATGSSASKRSDLGSTPDAVVGSSSQAVNGATSPSPHGAQSSSQSGSQNNSPNNSRSSSQSTPHSQPDASQVAAVVPKAIDNGASQAQTPVASGTTHDVATAASAPNAGTDAVAQSSQRADAVAKQSDIDEAVTPSSIHAATLTQTLGDTEMRVGMHSSEFGSISIRTTVSQQQMVAQISLDHAGLSQAIASHVSGVQAKIGNEYGLHASIQVSSQNSSSSSGQSGQSGQPGQSQPREQKAFAPSFQTENSAVPVEADVGVSPAALVDASSGYRLDIRA